MKITTKGSVQNVLFLALLLWYGNVWSQTKTETQYIAISTGHPSITLTLYHNGLGVECNIVNSNPTVKYDISYAVDYEFICGTDQKTISDNGTVLPNGKMTSLSQLMSDCVDSNGKRTANSVRNARLANFNATPVQEKNTSAVSTTNSNSGENYSNYSTTTTNSRPPANASVQELSEWQRKQYSNQNSQQQTQNTNTVTKERTQPNSSGNGASMANLQQIINDNQKRSEERLGVKSYANDAEMADDIAKGVGEIIDLFRANRELDRKEEERKRAAEERRKFEEVAAQQRVDNRKTIINEFRPNDIPLGSKEKASKIYYFVYAYDNSINELYSGATMYVSNVFEIGTYDDGTRAYTATINNEIADLTPFKEVLHGYYYTLEEAETLRESFISLLSENDVAIYTNIYYKGKPTTTTTKGGTAKQENFWGETVPSENTAKPSELPREEQKKKKDFWD